VFERFYPDKMAENVFELSEKFFKDRNIKGVVFDIDNTLVTHDTPVPPRDILDYLDILQKNGIKFAVVSNNHKERVDLFCRELGCPYIARAWKPFKKNLLKIKNALSLPEEEICLVGDQLFTDIYGGKRMGFRTVLVTAVGKSETKFVAFKRFFEQLVISEYNKRAKKGEF
jgi:HAD superfamily phosphatase (TIGR01668 family)